MLVGARSGYTVENERVAMERTIAYAKIAEQEDVERLLLEYDMGISGDIGEYVVVKTAAGVCAVGKLLQVQQNCFYLEVMGVSNGLRKAGLGGFLLSELIHDPWRYCRSAEGMPSANYLINTIARGEAAAFYKRHGFKPGSFSILMPPYSYQCEDCPDRETCAPVPMIFEAGG
jgi:N-acetylglutamate synthase-like GNAT family acetyltransferase